MLIGGGLSATMRVFGGPLSLCLKLRCSPALATLCRMWNPSVLAQPFAQLRIQEAALGYSRREIRGDVMRTAYRSPAILTAMASQFDLFCGNPPHRRSAARDPPQWQALGPPESGPPYGWTKS